MAIDLIKQINTIDDYKEYNFPTVYYVNDIKKILFTRNPDKLVETDEIIASDIVLSKKDGKKVFIHYDSYNLDVYPKDEYTPIGLVTIPFSHNVYGDGSCGVMSLRLMSSTSPTVGSASNIHTEGENEVYLFWGEYGKDVVELEEMNTSISTNNEHNEVFSVSGVPNLPSDYYNSGTSYIHDPKAYYCPERDNTGLSPSPYLEDGSRNTSYYSKIYGINACSDFDGKGNTNVLLGLRGEKDYSTWKPGWNVQTDYAAASCCDMFFTEGTNQGDWYLPSVGEMGYFVVRLGSIMNALNKINEVYGESTACIFKIKDYYWTSTERSANNGCSIYPYTGQIDSFGRKDYDFFTIAYTKLKEN